MEALQVAGITVKQQRGCLAGMPASIIFFAQ
jgi:hypothetical protein